jgi:hypothetical protein
MTGLGSEASIITNEKEWNLFRRMVVTYELSHKLKQHKRLWKWTHSLSLTPKIAFYYIMRVICRPLLNEYQRNTPCFIILSGISEVCSSETNSPTGDESVSVKRVNNQVLTYLTDVPYVLLWWLDWHQFCNLALARHVATYQHRRYQLQPRFSVEALVNLLVKGARKLYL